MADKLPYSANDIPVLNIREAIRKRPGMYVGEVKNAVNFLIKELLENIFDEAIIGNATEGIVTIKGDGTIEVSDNGQGIPTDEHGGKSFLELAVTTSNWQGHYWSRKHAFSMGLVVVNMMSKSFTIKTHYNGRLYEMSFNEGIPVSSLQDKGQSNSKGTTILFKPDYSVIGDSQINLEGIIKAAEIYTMLCPALKIRIKQGHSETALLYPKGIIDKVSELSGGKPVYICGDCTIQDMLNVYHPQTHIIKEPPINIFRTFNGGSTFDGFFQSLTVIFKRYANERGKMPEKIEMKVEDNLYEAWLDDERPITMQSAIDYSFFEYRVREYVYFNPFLTIEVLKDGVKKLYDSNTISFIPPWNDKLLFRISDPEAFRPVTFEAAFAFSGQEKGITTYMNADEPKLGGPHLDGFKTALSNVITPWFHEEERDKIKDRIFNRIICILSVTAANVRYYGATKSAVENKELYPLMANAVTAKLTAYFEKNLPMKGQIIKALTDQAD